VVEQRERAARAGTPRQRGASRRVRLAALPGRLLTTLRHAGGRTLTGVGVALLLVGMVVSPASAMLPTDPWVPPSVASHDGLASGVLAVGGVHVDLPVPSDQNDLYTAESGGYCGVHFTSWSWGSVGGDSVVTINYTLYGSDQVDCDPVQTYDGPGLRTWPHFLCVINNQGGWNGHPIGYVANLPKSYDFGTAGVMTFRSTGCGTPDVWGFDTGTGGGAFAADGLRTYRPGYGGVQPITTAVTTCSDNSTVMLDFGPGMSVIPAACATGDLVSVGLSASGVGLGTTAVHAPFVGNPCLTTAGGCALKVTWPGGSCTNRDPVCTWWGFTDAATECAWQDVGSAEMWALDPADCEAARHDGFETPPGQNTPSPSPSPGPVDGTPAIVGAVEAAARAVVTAVGNVLNGINQGFNQAAAQVAGVGQQVADIPGAIVRAVVPDAGVMAGLNGRAGSALGSPLQGWTDALGQLAGAFAVPEGGCQGPPFSMARWGTYYPFTTCTGTGATTAGFVKAAIGVGFGFTALLACFRLLSSSLGYQTGKGVT